jgi:CO dehydrogenase/acetyl-CoA synthase beta subunit
MVEGVRQTVKNFYAENPFTAKVGHVWEKKHLAERFLAKISEKFPDAVIEEVDMDEIKAAKEAAKSTKTPKAEKAPKAEKVKKEKKVKVEKTKVESTDMSDFDEILWEKHGFNEKCLGCLRTCKQHAAAKIVKCPEFKAA